ncbi:Ku protein [Roseiterribacter gracilis]|uniref:Non-homologous end joining protein Ku n=1 Tax=Roseiterribacter gracilis TaxID=2812848 RepID=A0A8S8X646_9PROT|nr:non-homologous end joining protein Ku [Rhodospirillales bacterium TMPK1]
MAAAKRTTWKGHLKLSLVTAPVRLAPATTAAERIHFHQLNSATGNRVKQRLVDATTGKEVDRDDIVKGFEVSKGHYVEITNEELEKVDVPTAHMIDIERFVDASDVNEIYLDTPYYVVPDGNVAEEAYGVIRDAMAQTEKAAIARVTLSTREHPVLLKACGNGLILTTLRDEREVRHGKDYFADIPKKKSSRELLSVATDLIKRLEGPFDPGLFEDRYQAALRKLVKTKSAGKEIPEPKHAVRGDNVIDLMDALKQSLGKGAAAKKATKKAPAKKKATAKKRAGGRR